MKADSKLPASGKEKTARVDLGLELARLHKRPGEAWTQARIAAFCGCSVRGVQWIENAALRKLERQHRERTRLTEDRVALGTVGL